MQEKERKYHQLSGPDKATLVLVREICPLEYIRTHNYVQYMKNPMLHVHVGVCGMVAAVRELQLAAHVVSKV